MILENTANDDLLGENVTLYQNDEEYIEPREKCHCHYFCLEFIDYGHLICVNYSPYINSAI